MRFILLISFLFITFSIIGQNKFVSHDYISGNIPSYKPNYQENYPKWAKMLYSENINYSELIEDYEQWKVNYAGTIRPIERYFKLWQRNIRSFVKKDGSIKLSDLSTNNNLYLQNKPIQHLNSALEWKFLGPKETYWLNESGSNQAPEACPWQVNIYSFDIAKKMPSTLYCGTETGFVNKSTDNGDSWQLLAREYNFGGGITSVAIHPNNENIVYVAANMQIHKTVDGGQTWMPLLSTNAQFYADQITIDPLNPNILFTAGSSGVFRSNDEGISWNKVWDHPSYDIHLKPENSEIVYAISSINGNFGILISEDSGLTFHEDSNFPSVQDAAGGLLAVSPAASDMLLAILLSSNNTPLLYKANMSTGNWELTATGQTNAFPLNNGQGFFDLALEVSPIDADLIFAGTSTLYKSTNGGIDFSIIGGYGGAFPIHPDIQSLKILDNGSTWVATDGGFTHSTDNFISTTNAKAKNKNLVGSDMWGFDQGWNQDIIVGGRYHNGNTAIADFYQPKAIRMGGAESPTGWVMKGKNRQVAFNDLGAGWILPKTAESAPEGRFIFSKYPNMDEYGGRRGNMLFHPNYYEVIYLGEGNAFWKSSDMGTSFELLHDFGGRILFCQIAYDDPNIIYVDIVNQGLFQSKDGGYTWISKPSLTDGTNGTSYWNGKLHFAISPNDANTIYACLQNGTWSSDIGKIYKSTNGGDSWENWTGTLNEYTKVLLIQPDQDGNDILYLFSDNNSNNSGQSYVRRSGDDDWSIFGSQYPAGISPNHALPFFRDSKIRVAGNGGIWENSLADPNFKPIIQPWVERPFVDCMLDTLQFDDHSILNHNNCNWTWDIQPTPLFIDDINKRNPKVVLGSPGSYEVTLTVVKDGISYSKTISDMINTVECPSIDNCENPAILQKESWSLLYVDSEEVGSPGLATMAFDNNPETIWHTKWSTGSDPYPHEIQIDLGDQFDIYEMTYYPRQNGQNGWIKDYELYFTDDLSDWGVVDTVGVFEKSAAPHKVVFQSPKLGRYFKLVALSEVNGNPWASASELEIRGCYHETVATENIKNHKALKAFPVPTPGIFKISLPSNELYNYSIYTLSGQLIKKGRSQSNDNLIQLDLSAFANNMYIIRLLDESNRSYYIKVLKEG